MKQEGIPLPKEPRHQRFADLVLVGRSLVDAYLEAGFSCSRATANANAKKLRKRQDVEAYIVAQQERAAGEANLSLQEILRFCARVVRTPITKLDPRSEDGPDSDLIKSFTINDGETSSSVRVEKYDAFRAIETHLKLSGEDPAANAINAMAEALAKIGMAASPLPTDKM